MFRGSTSPFGKGRLSEFDAEPPNVLSGRGGFETRPYAGRGVPVLKDIRLLNANPPRRF